MCYNPADMVTKRQLGIALIVVALATIVGVIAADRLAMGQWSGFGPLQWLGIACGALGIGVGLILVGLGNRPA